MTYADSTLYRRCAVAFEAEWPAYEQIAVDSVTMAEVVRLVRRYALRGYDAIHLAAVLWMRRHPHRLARCGTLR